MSNDKLDATFHGGDGPADPSPLTEAREALANPFDFSRKDRALRDLIAYTETLEAERDLALEDLETAGIRMERAEATLAKVRSWLDGDPQANRTHHLRAILDVSAVPEAPAPTEPEWEYGAGYERHNGIEDRWFSLADPFTVREAAEHQLREYIEDPQVRLVRRAKPGPWEPVARESSDV